MARFLIEVEHDEGVSSCMQVIQTFLQTGSHFLSNADWGCKDGEHKAWIIVDLDSKEEALSVLPPVFRSNAKVIQLNKFNMEDVDEIVRYHKS
jgi:hypothetical protein